jgi:DNA-directed RNA polymerase specialized sigma24 family protein
MFTNTLSPSRSISAGSHGAAPPMAVTARTAQLREAVAGPGREVARNALAAAIRSLCMDVLSRLPIPAEVTEDLTHTMLPALMDRIQQGAVTPGLEDAYVRATARNRARDHFREQSGVRERASLGDDPDELPAPRDSAEDLLVESEEARARAALAKRIVSLIALAPDAYRRVLDLVYLAGRPIEELVVQELARRGVDPTDVVERRRARAAIDKTLQRARDWVRLQLEAGPPVT